MANEGTKYLGPILDGAVDLTGQLFDLFEARNSTVNGYGAKESEMQLSIASSVVFYIAEVLANVVDHATWRVSEIEQDKSDFKPADVKEFEAAGKTDLNATSFSVVMSLVMGLGEILIEWAGQRKRNYEKEDVHEILMSYPQLLMEALPELTKGNSKKAAWGEFSVKEKKVLLNDLLQDIYLEMQEHLKDCDTDELENFDSDVEGMMKEKLAAFFDTDSKKTYQLAAWDDDTLSDEQKKSCYRKFDDTLGEKMGLLGPYNAEDDKQAKLDWGTALMSTAIGLRLVGQVYQGSVRRAHEFNREKLVSQALKKK
jgi:hypothetical protein